MGGSVRGDERGDEREGLRRRVGVATAVAVALGGGAVVAGCLPTFSTPSEVPVSSSVEAPVSASLNSGEQDLEKIVRSALESMGLSGSSQIKIEVSDRQVIVTEEVELADAVVAERAFDRAEELAESIDATRADTVTWVADNGKGAKAAVTVDADTSKVEKAAPRDVAAKLNAAVGYAISGKAYEPVKAQVKTPSAGEVPKGGDGKELVTPAKVEVTEAASRKPAEKADSSTNDTTKQATEDGGNGKAVSETGNSSSGSSNAGNGNNTTSDSGTGSGSSSSGSSGDSSSSNSSGNSSGGSSSGGGNTEPQPHWVDEQGHYEDVYEAQNVWVGNHYVVDTAARDEPVYEEVKTYWCGCGKFETTDPDAFYEHTYQHSLNEEVFGGGIYYPEKQVGTKHYDEVGHWEDDYETRQVVVGQRWVVDVPGHWE